jgi:hypothetical protein
MRVGGRPVTIGAALVCAMGVFAGCGAGARSTTPSPEDVITTTMRSTPSSRPVAASASSPPAARSVPPILALTGTASQRTPGGQWWGVDSTAAITEASLANVRGYYAGGQTPLVWGRYVSGSYALYPVELAFAQAHSIFVYLLVPDRDCSVCNGGRDVCGNDHRPDQASADAQDAIDAAKRAGIPTGAVLFKDIEQIGSCEGELTATYLDTWYQVLTGSPYRAGFYGNAYRQSNDFPRAYCQLIQTDPAAIDIELADDEPEPAIGAPPGTTGPATAPAFAPDSPTCAPERATKIWQYGESTSHSNNTDIDQVQPDTAGILTPSGGVT